MKRPSPLLRRGNDTDMNATMTPMIDVVFLLLVFFVWTASFQIVEMILPTKLSAQMGSDTAEIIEPIPEQDFENLVVKIKWDGAKPTWLVNDELANSLEDVQARLQAVAAIKPDSVVILNPESVVPLGHVIDVYDVIKLSGFGQVNFAVNQTQ